MPVKSHSKISRCASAFSKNTGNQSPNLKENITTIKNRDIIANIGHPLCCFPLNKFCFCAITN